MVHFVYILNGFYPVDFKCFVPFKAATNCIQKVKKVRRNTCISPLEGKIQKILTNHNYSARQRMSSVLCTPKRIFTERLENNRWLRYYCTKAQLNLIVLSRATSLVSNGNNITSRVSLPMKMCQILSASTTLSCRIGLFFCVFQGGRGQSEAKARKTRDKREKSAKPELRARGASQKNPACPHSII